MARRSRSRSGHYRWRPWAASSRESRLLWRSGASSSRTAFGLTAFFANRARPNERATFRRLGVGARTCAPLAQSETIFAGLRALVMELQRARNSAGVSFEGCKEQLEVVPAKRSASRDAGHPPFD